MLKLHYSAAQRISANHEKGIATIKAAAKSLSKKDFRECFTQSVDRVLVIFKRETTVERCIDFVVKCVTSVFVESGDIKHCQMNVII